MTRVGDIRVNNITKRFGKYLHTFCSIVSFLRCPFIVPRETVMHLPA